MTLAVVRERIVHQESVVADLEAVLDQQQKNLMALRSLEKTLANAVEYGVDETWLTQSKL